MNGHREYKGYVGIFRVDDDADVIRGKVVNTKDTITFQGESVEQAVIAFHESVDDYMAFCESLGEKPEKPFSGKITIRLAPEVHRALNHVAQVKGVSFNRLVSQELKKVALKAANATTQTSVPTTRESGNRKTASANSATVKTRALVRPKAKKAKA